MKNQLFDKLTLVMGSMVLFSSQALAFSSNSNQNLIGVDKLGGSETIVAQVPTAEQQVGVGTFFPAIIPQLDIPGFEPGVQGEILPIEEQFALAQSVAQAFTAVGNATAVSNAAAFPNESDRIAVAQSLAQASSILGNSLAIANSGAATTGDAAAIAQSLAQANTLVGDATALAGATASSEDGPAIAQAGAQAQTSIGNATAAATASAS